MQQNSQTFKPSTTELATYIRNALLSVAFGLSVKFTCAGAVLRLKLAHLSCSIGSYLGMRFDSKRTHPFYIFK